MMKYSATDRPTKLLGRTSTNYIEVRLMTDNGFTGRFDEPWVQELIDHTGRMAKATIVDFLIEPEPAKLEMVIAAVEYLGVDELMALALWAGVEPWTGGNDSGSNYA